MIGFPHPSSMIRYAHDRRADLLAEAERDRLIQSGRIAAPQRRPRGFAAVVAAMFAIALLLAVGAVIIEQEPPQQSGLLFSGGAATTRAETHLLDPGAVDTGDTARLSL